jgi:crotonobetainyl-CoA:carnitine CoA-transferase CaiB-like acyl-CoA transferase
VNTYRTRDGRYISLMMLQADRHWPEFTAAIGRPELAQDPRFAEGAERYQHRRECVTLIDEIFASRTFEEWRRALSGIDGVWAPVQTPTELLTEPQALENGYVTELTHSGGTKFRMVPSPLQFNEEPATLVPAPEHGEHTDEVLLELGLPMDEILDLKVRGAIL